MIVIGDAAHATAPSVGQAFAAYERLRRGRVERIVARGARTSNSKAAGPAGRAPRDLMLPVILKHVAGGGSLAWMRDHHTDWDEKVAA